MLSRFFANHPNETSPTTRLSLTCPSPRLTIPAQWLRRHNPWGKRFPITASFVRSEAGGWAWSMKLKT